MKSRTSSPGAFITNSSCFLFWDDGDLPSAFALSESSEYKCVPGLKADIVVSVNVQTVIAGFQRKPFF